MDTFRTFEAGDQLLLTDTPQSGTPSSKPMTAEGAAALEALLQSGGVVRFDSPQTPLNSTQLGQFLDNLGRSADVLDLGVTDLKANAFLSDTFMEASGTFPLAAWNSGTEEWTAYISYLNAPYVVDLVYGKALDFDGNPSIDWGNRTLSADNNSIASWSYDTFNTQGVFDVQGVFSTWGIEGYSGTFYDYNNDEVVVSGGIILSVG